MTLPIPIATEHELGIAEVYYDHTKLPGTDLPRLFRINCDREDNELPYAVAMQLVLVHCFTWFFRYHIQPIWPPNTCPEVIKPLVFGTLMCIDHSPNRVGTHRHTRPAYTSYADLWRNLNEMRRCQNQYSPRPKMDNIEWLFLIDSRCDYPDLNYIPYPDRPRKPRKPTRLQKEWDAAHPQPPPPPPPAAPLV